MSRCAALYVFCIFFSLTSIAQTLREKDTGSEVNNSDAHVPSTPGPRLNIRGDTHISITRLREPSKAQGLYNKAMEAWTKGRPAEALRKLDEALKVYPSFPEALTFYGCIHATFRHWESAEEKLQAAIQTDPTYSPVHIVLAGVYNAQARFDEAQRVIQLGIAAGANTWHVQYEIAHALIGKHDYEDALATAETALRAKPDGGLPHLAKAHALLGLQRYPQAATELNTFLVYQPSGDGSEQTRELLQKIQRMLPP